MCDICQSKSSKIEVDELETIEERAEVRAAFLPREYPPAIASAICEERPIFVSLPRNVISFVAFTRES